MKPEGRRKRRDRICAGCGQRTARYQRPSGGYGRDRQHNLCMACYQAALDSLHAMRIADEQG